MSNQINPAKKSLTIKDLVTTGIFSAIFLVFTMIGGIFFAPNPVLTFYMPMGAALLCGPVYLLMIAKVQKRWSVTILGIIMGIIWFVRRRHARHSILRRFSRSPGRARPLRGIWGHLESDRQQRHIGQASHPSLH